MLYSTINYHRISTGEIHIAWEMSCFTFHYVQLVIIGVFVPGKIKLRLLTDKLLYDVQIVDDYNIRIMCIYMHVPVCQLRQLYKRIVISSRLI